MKYLMLGLFVLNVYFAFQGYTLNAFVAGWMFTDSLSFLLLKVKA